jgi:uncharacterized protein YfdQ (DUF2303 family)
MDASAIKEIADNAAISEINQALTNFPVVVIPDTAKIESIEKFKNAPDQFRGTFTSTTINEFIAYINDNASADSAVFIDAENMRAKAIVDFGTSDTPLWGKHRAVAALAKTPAYNDVLIHDQKTHLQQELIDFCEDWEEHVHFFDETGAGMDFKKTINTLRRVKVNAKANAEQEIGNYSGSRSTLEQVEIKAGADELPAGFAFEVIPYDEFNPVVLTCQLRAIHKDGNVTFKYRINQLQAKQLQIADEFKQAIKNRVTVDSLAIYLGEMAYQQQ